MIDPAPLALRLRALLKRRGVLLALACGGLAAVLSAFVPLLSVPGFESALAANLAVGLCGGALGIAASRVERQAGAAHPSSAVLLAFASAAILAVALVAFFLLASLTSALVFAACSLTDGLLWYPLLPLPSALLASAAGVLCGASSERRFVPGALYALLLSISFASTAWPVLFGPQVFLYDHFLGHLPGPLYDEVVRMERPLLVFRLQTFLFALLALLVAWAFWDRGRLRPSRPRAIPSALAAVVALILAAGWAVASETGWRQSNRSIADKLGGQVEGQHCTLFHPREMKASRVARFVDECDARVEELEAFFGSKGPRPRVFLYRSAAEKRALVGASGTQFAKPWLAQLHVDARGYPHPVLKHELAHVIAASLGRAPFGVTAVAFGLFPVQGLVEGAAVAADWPADEELTIHEQSRALRELGIAPSLPRILSAVGFYGESARRAYTYAGSFVRWLVETRGTKAFGRLYLDGDFAAAYGAPLAELVKEWEAYLDEVPLPEQARAIAERRFRRPAIFRRPCAREVARLASEASDALAAGDAARASVLYGRCSALDAGDPLHLVSRARAYAAQARPDDVEGILGILEAHPSRSDILVASVLGYLGDAHAAGGDLDSAEAAYRRARALPLDDDRQRALDVKLDAVRDASLAAAVLPYLADGGEGRLLAVRELLVLQPDFATGWYLVGRRALQRDEPALAVQWLDRALELGLPSEPLTREARRNRALALLDAGRALEACVEFEALTELGSAAQRLHAEDLLRLCRHRATRTAAKG